MNNLITDNTNLVMIKTMDKQPGLLYRYRHAASVVGQWLLFASGSVVTVIPMDLGCRLTENL